MAVREGAPARRSGRSGEEWRGDDAARRWETTRLVRTTASRRGGGGLDDPEKVALTSGPPTLPQSVASNSDRCTSRVPRALVNDAIIFFSLLRNISNVGGSRDHTLTQYQSREVQDQLRRIEQALIDGLEIPFAPAPLRDALADDSETDNDLDD
ncbi:hypothetical protein Syun_031421 [Stephania yunnanensis]|uniref:Uncharacterized protein n=1 Tax=Stephania yunnanensis TaxID=152371 RepID=A0AAP0E2S9_9MAGN